MLGGKRFQHDMIIVFVHDSAGPLINFKIFSKPPRDDDLSFHSKHHRVGFWCWIHDRKYYRVQQSKSSRYLLELLSSSKPIACRVGRRFFLPDRPQEPVLPAHRGGSASRMGRHLAPLWTGSRRRELKMPA